MKNGKLDAKEQQSAEDFTLKIVNELTPVLRDVSKVIVNAELPVGEISGDELKMKLYKDVAKQVLVKLNNANIRWTDRNLLFKLALQPLDLVREKVVNSLNSSYESASDKTMGKTMEELRLNDLDEILKK